MRVAAFDVTSTSHRAPLMSGSKFPAMRPTDRTPTTATPTRPRDRGGRSG